MARWLAIGGLAIWMAACGGGDEAGVDAASGDPGVALDPGSDDPGPATGDEGGRDEGPAATDATDPGPAATDEAPADAGPHDPGAGDPGPGTIDATPPDAGPLGTKTAGMFCNDAAECANGMSCVAGQYTPKHCNILCSSTEECKAIAPEAAGECQNFGQYSVCLFKCGMFGGNAPCPGQLPCGGAYCG